ncbi:MAG: molybdopterin molybdotransferase MoeA [Acidobacteria bacterium]|nr:molybdopterin molybdotransferase MoeA [Acidobacteriota bacterium]
MVSKPLLSVEEAEKALMGFPVRVQKEIVSLAGAHGRYLAEDVSSPIAVPEFDKSAMDGYAIIALDPAPTRKVIETIAAGTPPRLAVTPGHCARIMTGAMLPAGADRVVMRECTEETTGVMRIIAEDANANIRFRGEDIQPGQKVMAAGTRLRAAQVALLASLGLAEVPVARPPRVGVITTGSELTAPGSPLEPGRIYDSNSPALAAQLRETGAEPLALGGVADSAEATVAAIASALDACDVLILSGGVSAGDFDFVPAAMKQAGFHLHFEKIAVQPGMPTVFGSRGEKVAFGLPGNPVSTFVIFEVFIKPLLLRLLGHVHQPVLQPVELTTAFRRSRAERTAFLPVNAGDGRAELVSYHGSAHLHALSRANALLRIPAGVSAIAAGSIVHVRFL